MKVKFNRIKIITKNKKIKQRTLAKKLGISVVYLNAIINNRAQPPLHRLYLIAHEIGVSPKELLYDAPEIE